ncbi:MAG: membrane dipeptidase [Planctomycetes bacterium]|nr:membrane dipeptidase [Planctomycetota bacterium]
MVRCLGELVRHSSPLALLSGIVLSSVIGIAAEPTRMTDEALTLHRQSFVFDGHNNLAMQLRKRPDLTADSVDLNAPQSKLHTDIPRLRRGGVGAEFFATFVSADSVKKGTAVRETLEQIDQVVRLVKRHSDAMEWAGSTADLDRIHKADKVAALIAVEGGNAIENSLVVLQTYFKAGARCLALTHDDTTEWADAALDKPKHKGLAKFGEQVVTEMNRLGMVIDLSHASEETALDTLSLSTAPVIFSHTGAHQLAPHPRNVSDDVLKAVAKNGGVVMVNFYSGFLTTETVKAYEKRTKAAADLRKSFKTDEQFQIAIVAWLKEHPLPTTGVKDVVDHIDYIGKVAGFDHVGLGSNFDGVVSLPQNLEDVSCFPHLTQEMLNRGYSREQVQKVLGGNAQRAFREVEAVAKRNSGESATTAAAGGGE